jgi:malonyl-CoA O-methyltransferase
MTPDQARTRRAFSQAAEQFDTSDFLHTEIRNRLLDRLQLVLIEPDAIVDLGAGTMAGTVQLANKFPDARVVALDFSDAMLRQPSFDIMQTHQISRLCAEASALPIKDRSIDLIFSSLMLQHSPAPSAVLREARRILRYPGLLIFATLGRDSFRELSKAWEAADEFTHVPDYVDMHDLGDALIQSGFAEPVMHSEILTITYAELPKLMADLRATGSINATETRNKNLTSRRIWQKMAEAYSAQRNAEGLLPVTLNIVYGIAWCGDPDAQRPSGPDEFEIPLTEIAVARR